MSDLKLNYKYAFKHCEQKDFTIVESREHYIIFREDHLEWVAEYTGTYHEEEDDKHGVKKDITRDHKWRKIILKQAIYSVEIYQYFDEGLWMVKWFTIGGANDQVAFYTEDNAKKLHNLFTEYILSK